MEMKYISSLNKKFDLYSANMEVKQGNFHSYKWKIDKNDDKPAKEPISYKLVFRIRGKLEERKRLLNELTNAFEGDIARNIPGTIWFGDYAVKCFITESETGCCKDNVAWSQREVTLYCPLGFWIKNKKYEFGRTEIKSTGNKKYAGRYPYRYEHNNGSDTINNDGYADTDFKIIIYGPCANPLIKIGPNKYSVKIILQESERLEIDSHGTILKFLSDGVKENAFNCREKNIDFFKKIPAGYNSVQWTGKILFDVILHIERSEPQW